MTSLFVVHIVKFIGG